jgi:hypothetical protein
MAAVLGLAGSTAIAQTPGEIGHQGILTDSLGNPFTSGSFELTFTLYNQESGGSALWSETQNVNVEEGLFTVLLGEVNPIDLAFDQPYWLDVQVDGDVLDPRLRFSASPYSRRAATVDSVGPQAIRLKTIPANRLDPAAAPENAVLAVVGPDSAGWTFLESANIWPKSIRNTSMSPQGGGSGQVLTVQGDSVGWANPPEITGAAIPDKSVRSTKLNAEDGAVGQVLVAADEDSVTWSTVGPTGIADRGVTASKLSQIGGVAGQILVARGDSVAWTDGAALNEGSIPTSKLSSTDVPQGQVLLVTDGDTAGWGLVSNPSVANQGIGAEKLSTEGGETGQILTVNGAFAVWSDPAGIEEGSIPYDRLSPDGGNQGEVLVVAPGDTVGWSQITAANIAAGSVTPSRLDVNGAGDGQVLSVDGGTAAWSPIDGTTILNSSVPVWKLDPGIATAGDIMTYDGGNVVWTPDGVTLPFSGAVASTDTFGIRVSSPSVIEGSGFAIQGIMTSPDGGAFASAIRGENRSTSALGVGVWGSHEGGGWGVYGRSTSGRGVYGSSPDGFEGYFSGNVRVTGSIEKAGGSFKIDHPLDPENRYLLHSFVESPDMMNVYNGNVTLDASGEAVVVLPDWFQALNTDYRYQLTPIGAPGPNLHIAQEIAGNTFRIAGGTLGMKVSWQVTGIRNDAWARENRIPVEQTKEGAEQGTYLHPEAFGLSESLGTEAATEQQTER